MSSRCRLRLYIIYNNVLSLLLCHIISTLLFIFDELSNMSTTYVEAYFIKKGEGNFQGDQKYADSFYIFFNLISRGSQENEIVSRKKRYKNEEIRFEKFYDSTTTKPHFSVASYTTYSRVTSLTLCVLPLVVFYNIDALV